MNKGFQIRGDFTNPYHLSVGAIIKDKNLIALIKKPDGIYTLPRETMYSNESFEDTLNRGVESEVGVKVKILKYIGSLITHFSRPDGTDVEKTTVYFLSEMTGAGTKAPQEDEVDDSVEWVEKGLCKQLLQQQQNEEYKLIDI